MKIYLLIGIFFTGWLAIIPSSKAQLIQEHRFEETVAPNEEGFTIISLKNEGLAIIREKSKYEGGKKKWQLEIVDTTLTRIWSTEIELSVRLTMVGYEYNAKHLYLLFREGETDYHNFQLLTLQFYDRTTQTDNIRFELNFKLTHFTMAGSSAVFGGYVNNEPAVLLYNQSSDHPKVLPGLFNKDISLLDVRTNQNQSFNVLLTETKSRDKKHMILRTFDHEGNLLIDDIIEVDTRFTILSGITSSLEQEEMIIAGTYGEGSQRMALGIFSVLVDPFNEQQITYTDFCSLDHFLDYMNPRRAAKIRAKAEKDRSNGQLPDFKSYASPIRIDEHANGFYLLLETYFPSDNSTAYAYPYLYSPTTYGYYPYGMNPFSSRYYNAPYSYNNPVRNSSVQMNQSAVIKLNTHGIPQMDVSMKLDDIRSNVLEQVGDFAVVKDSIVQIYKKENEIVLQREMQEGDTIPPTKRIKIKLKETEDVLKNEREDEEGTIRFWYDRHFYVWGYQRIKANGETRYVFYVNRATLE